MSGQPSSPDQGYRLLAALAYPIPIVLALVIVLTDMKNDRFMRHHGWTALFWGIAWLIVKVGLGILAMIPFLGWLLVWVTGPILWLVWLVLSIYYAIQAYNGREVEIPIVSDYAKRYTT
jgi:uncharacterized membrane protein